MKSICVIFILAFSVAACADPFDAFVGVYTPTKSAIRVERVENCNRFDFAEMTSFEVRPDRTGFRQTHELRIVVANGYSSLPVVPGYHDSSSLNSTIGSFGQSEGDDQKAMTIQGTFGANKNETLSVTLEKVETEVELKIANELKSADDKVLAGCYYSATLKKVP